MGAAATLTHLLLWNHDDLRGAWSWTNRGSLKRMWTGFNWRIWNADGKREVSPDSDLDPHYREMLKVPFCFYYERLQADLSPISIQTLLTVGMVPFWSLRLSPQLLSSTKLNRLFHGEYLRHISFQLIDTRLHRWGFVIACLLAVVLILFYGSLIAITGLFLLIQPFPQMIWGFLHPGKPMANMYFVLFSYSESPITV